MNCVPRRTFGPPARGDRARRAFTLAEVLAALLFMSLVIPVAIQGLRIAGLAGSVAERKTHATRVAERILNESLVTTNWNKPSQDGVVQEGSRQLRWSLRSEPWGIGTLQLVTVEVLYGLQGLEYSVRLSTLADGSLAL